MDNKKIIIAVIAAILIAGGGIVAWSFMNKTPASPPSEQAQTAGTETANNAPAASGEAGIGGQIFDNAQANPMQSLPDVNPIKGNMNPLQDIKTNPFE